MDPPEELRAIGGIGPSRARWLAETLGVKSAAELAALSPSELEARVRDPGCALSAAISKAAGDRVVGGPGSGHGFEGERGPSSS